MVNSARETQDKKRRVPGSSGFRRFGLLALAVLLAATVSTSRAAATGADSPDGKMRAASANEDPRQGRRSTGKAKAHKAKRTAKKDTPPAQAAPAPAPAQVTPAPTPAAGETPATPAEAKPLWVCEKPTVFAEPVWQGDPVVCKFEFSNQGTADLDVKLKKG